MKIKTLNYASKMQSITMQDIEVKEFETNEKMISYLLTRFDFDDKHTVFVYFYDSTDSNYLDAKVTRDRFEIIDYLRYSNYPDCFNVFECESYMDAVLYLRSYFEQSDLFEL
jgi:hypothetical protein